MNVMQEIVLRGLEDVAKKSPAYEVMLRITNAGKDLVNPWPETDKEMQRAYDEDTAETSRVLSNPINWGIEDDGWKEFCKEWK